MIGQRTLFRITVLYSPTQANFTSISSVCLWKASEKIGLFQKWLHDKQNFTKKMVNQDANRKMRKSSKSNLSRAAVKNVIRERLLRD